MFPNDKGTYAIILKNSRQQRIRAGRVFLEAPVGFFVYCGSAFGSGGINSRASRHLKPFKKLRWHIDYIRKKMSVTSVCFSTAQKNQEHEWAKILSEMGGKHLCKGFGSSDCKCESHLLYFENESFIKTFLQNTSTVQIINLKNKGRLLL